MILVEIKGRTESLFLKEKRKKNMHIFEKKNMGRTIVNQ